MNKKDDILDAWITIEQLSEGSIKKRDKNLRIFPQSENFEFDDVFFECLNTQKQVQKVSDKLFKKSGIVFYFDIFNFQEIIDILRQKYRITSTNEELDNSEKFSFAMYFDNQLNFIADKFFFTMSGYIRYKKKLPEDFLKAESNLRDDLDKQFEDQNFTVVLNKLLRQYRVSLENCRYGYVKNLEVDDVNLHSFFIDDLQKAKQIDTENLNRYFSGFSGNRLNLDSKKDSEGFDWEVFQEILQPKYYPLGRFSSSSTFALSFMQEVAVNLGINQKNSILSVNGPPGTGKTTLLKDLFAEVVVQQAVEICELSNKEIKGSIVYWEKAKLGCLPYQIAEKNSVVASSNNGAVQNIVKELPRIDQISEEFRKQLLEIDYFKTAANSEISVHWSVKDGKKTRELTKELLEETNWGSFSIEGGSAVNVSKLLLTIEVINKYLEEEYQPNRSVYQEFLELYRVLSQERNEVQEYCEKIRQLPALTNEYVKEKNRFFEEEQKKLEELKTSRKRNGEIKIILEKNIATVKSELNTLESDGEELLQLSKDEQRNFNLIQLQKPRWLWWKKIVNKEKVNDYFDQLNQANDRLNEVSEQRKALKKEHKKYAELLKKQTNNLETVQKEITITNDAFDHWVHVKRRKLMTLEEKISSLRMLKKQMRMNDIDWEQSYDALQKSNPWFTQDFRIKQSQLFIKALQVRKQFLFENRKHLAAARRIWEKQDMYYSKENGGALLRESWQWLNFTIPIISTTFASFGRMFRNLSPNSIGHLFIDEAGQALPQASVGAIFRSKKIMVVGDPSQIKPVLPLDSNVLNLLGQNYQVDEKFVSSEASTQTIVDATSQYGFQKDDHEWTGIPLWVHRRSDYPMFSISNEISYNGLMVQGKAKEEAQGQANWFHIFGKAKDKFVKEQSEFLKAEILRRLEENPTLADEIYVISPFKNVAYRLAQELNIIGFTNYENGKATNVGTVHTFQGKEAKIVYFVLGADSESKGAAKWAVSEPNIMNVAATRAKEEFYIIGDKKLYSTIGSKVANQTIAIIDHYN